MEGDQRRRWRLYAPLRALTKKYQRHLHTGPVVCLATIFALSCVSSIIFAPAEPTNTERANLQLLSVKGPRASCPYYESIPSPFPASFWYIKNPKTGSSTLAGVFRSIAAHHGIAMVMPPPFTPILAFNELHKGLQRLYKRSEHVGVANHISFSQKAASLFQPPFLLFTSVREPLSQFRSWCIEQCLHRRLNDGQRKEAKRCFDTNVDEWMIVAQTMEDDRQLEYIRDAASTTNSSVEAAAAQYDFIFVQERLDESLVAFAVLYNLDFTDIVPLSAKVRQGSRYTVEKMPDDVTSLVRSKTVQDLRLWQHANELLDERIAEINRRCEGPLYFEHMLRTFRSLAHHVHDECAEFEAWYTAHNFTTLLSYWRDNGRAPRCRDHVVRFLLRQM